MKICVYGHEIPVLTLDDEELDDEDRSLLSKSFAVSIGSAGELDGNALPYSPNKATKYDVAAQIPGGPAVDFTLVKPPGDDDQLALPSLRPMRAIGRENPPADITHQVLLFHAVGAVTVAGGHVEMALRRVYVSLTGGCNADLDNAPTEWWALHEKLKRLCEEKPTEGICPELLKLLKSAEDQGLRDARNTIIHGYWWLIPMDNQYMWSGRYRKNKPPSNEYAKPENLLQLAKRLFEFAASLEALVARDWPIAIVPALGPVSSSATIRLRDRSDYASSVDRSAISVTPVPKTRPSSEPRFKQQKRRRKRKRR